jgi:hypothetical protein
VLDIPFAEVLGVELLHREAARLTQSVDVFSLSCLIPQAFGSCADLTLSDRAPPDTTTIRPGVMTRETLGFST